MNKYRKISHEIVNKHVDNLRKNGGIISGQQAWVMANITHAGECMDMLSRYFPDNKARDAFWGVFLSIAEKGGKIDKSFFDRCRFS